MERVMEYILTIANTQSVSKAAELLFISQPALSAIVKKEEKRLGVELFNRQFKPLQLTEAGEKYITAAKKIKEIEEKQQNEAMAEVLPADKYDLIKEDGFEYYNATSSGNTVGYVFVEKGKGYGGDVSVMVAIGTDKVIKSVKVLDVSNETPGLGQNSAKEEFYGQYKSKSKGISVVKNAPNEENNEIKAVTGATITSKAVTKAVNNALENAEKIPFNNEIPEVSADE